MAQEEAERRRGERTVVREVRIEAREAGAVEVEDAEHIGRAHDGHDDFRPGFEAARQIIADRRHVINDLVGALGDRHAADAAPDRDVRVLGRLADVVVQHQRVAFEQVDAHPVVMRALGLQHIGDTVEVPDNDASRGMVRQVRFLVTVEELPAEGSEKP